LVFFGPIPFRLIDLPLFPPFFHFPFLASANFPRFSRRNTTIEDGVGRFRTLRGQEKEGGRSNRSTKEFRNRPFRDGRRGKIKPMGIAINRGNLKTETDNKK
jgi:hypothetical protein